MTNSGNIFADYLTVFLVYKSGFKQSQCQIYIYYRYAPYGFKLFVLYYVDDCVYWYKYEYLVKGFVYTHGNRYHVSFLGYAHCLMSTIISELKDHYISMDQDRYDTAVFATYLDTTTIKENSKLHKTTLPHDMILSH